MRETTKLPGSSPTLMQNRVAVSAQAQRWHLRSRDTQAEQSHALNGKAAHESSKRLAVSATGAYIGYRGGGEGTPASQILLVSPGVPNGSGTVCDNENVTPLRVELCSKEPSSLQKRLMAALLRADEGS
ncbi:hypothetical protein MRX96_027176 [Rhipicephalus microplus]